MKKIISITVDVENFLSAQEKLGKGNISSYLNNCLQAVNGRTVKDKELETHKIELKQLDKELETLLIKKSIALETVKSLENAQLEREKELLDAEQNKRWICGVCKHENFMDQTRCSSCNLPTRHDPKTEVRE